MAACEAHAGDHLAITFCTAVALAMGGTQVAWHVAQVLTVGMNDTQRALHLAAFRKGGVRVLLMDPTGAPECDLTFVQHVFLMEPVLDPFLERQLIGCAHQLGATQAVTVEVLVTKVCLAGHHAS